MRGWMIVAACTLPFAALAQPDNTAASTPAAAPPAADAPASAAPPAAEPAAVSAPVAGQGFGAQTRFWLETQSSGAYAVTDDRPMPGEVATMVYQRYVNSFTHPIPERYESDSFKTTGGSTGN